ncbi:MAG: hypothetical protein ACM3JQ_05925 [Candidatus Eiseniibacteriota bacterium]|jgi:hypothetical protein
MIYLNREEEYYELGQVEPPPEPEPNEPETPSGPQEGTDNEEPA